MNEANEAISVERLAIKSLAETMSQSLQVSSLVAGVQEIGVFGLRALLVSLPETARIPLARLQAALGLLGQGRSDDFNVKLVNATTAIVAVAKLLHATPPVSGTA
jgi:hypothetical protein